MVPHAGYIYSGQVAGAVFRRLPARPSYIILCPNHTGRGAPLAMMSKGEWQTPLGAVRIDAGLAASLQHSCHLLMEDAKAHESEHAIEVQLPFLQAMRADLLFVPFTVGTGLTTLGGALTVLITDWRSQLGIARLDFTRPSAGFVDSVLERLRDPNALFRRLFWPQMIPICVGINLLFAAHSIAVHLAATRGPFEEYAKNSASMMAVLGMHRDALSRIKHDQWISPLTREARPRLSIPGSRMHRRRASTGSGAEPGRHRVNEHQVAGVQNGILVVHQAERRRRQRAVLVHFHAARAERAKMQPHGR